MLHFLFLYILFASSNLLVSSSSASCRTNNALRCHGNTLERCTQRVWKPLQRCSYKCSALSSSQRNQPPRYACIAAPKRSLPTPKRVPSPAPSSRNVPTPKKQPNPRVLHRLPYINVSKISQIRRINSQKTPIVRLPKSKLSTLVIKSDRGKSSTPIRLYLPKLVPKGKSASPSRTLPMSLAALATLKWYPFGTSKSGMASLHLIKIPLPPFGWQWDPSCPFAAWGMTCVPFMSPLGSVPGTGGPEGHGEGLADSGHSGDWNDHGNNGNHDENWDDDGWDDEEWDDDEWDSDDDYYDDGWWGYGECDYEWLEELEYYGEDVDWSECDPYMDSYYYVD